MNQFEGNVENGKYIPAPTILLAFACAEFNLGFKSKHLYHLDG